MFFRFCSLLRKILSDFSLTKIFIQLIFDSRNAFSCYFNLFNSVSQHKTGIFIP